MTVAENLFGEEEDLVVYLIGLINLIRRLVQPYFMVDSKSFYDTLQSTRIGRTQSI